MFIQFIIKILFRKDVETMAMVYALLIIKGKKDFADVPERIKEQVKQVLIDLDCMNWHSKKVHTSKLSQIRKQPLYDYYMRS